MNIPLVAIAACGFIQVAETVTAGNAEATARIVEGLVKGVGFIAGGAILVGKANPRDSGCCEFTGYRRNRRPCRARCLRYCYCSIGHDICHFDNSG